MCPFKIVGEDEEFIIYEFRTIQLYILYFIASLMVIGSIIDSPILSISGAVMMFIYFITVSLPYLCLNRKIKEAMKDSAIELSGSKFSFTQPLQIKISKKYI